MFGLVLLFSSTGNATSRMVLLSSGTAAGVPEVKMNPNCLSHLPMDGLPNAPGDVLSCYVMVLSNLYTLWWTNSLQLKMAIEIVDSPNWKWWFSTGMSVHQRVFLSLDPSWLRPFRPGSWMRAFDHAAKSKYFTCLDQFLQGHKRKWYALYNTQ